MIKTSVLAITDEKKYLTGSFLHNEGVIRNPPPNHSLFCYIFISVKYFITTPWYILVSVEDYTMLEKMNKVTAARYQDMKFILDGVNASVHDLNSKCKCDTVRLLG